MADDDVQSFSGSPANGYLVSTFNYGGPQLHDYGIAGPIDTYGDWGCSRDMATII